MTMKQIDSPSNCLNCWIRYTEVNIYFNVTMSNYSIKPQPLLMVQPETQRHGDLLTRSFYFQSRATRLYTQLCPFVGRLVGPHFTFFMFLRSLASLLLAKCFSNSNTAPAHPHATEVAVYPALFFSSIFLNEKRLQCLCYHSFLCFLWNKRELGQERNQRSTIIQNQEQNII